MTCAKIGKIDDRTAITVVAKDFQAPQQVGGLPWAGLALLALSAARAGRAR